MTVTEDHSQQGDAVHIAWLSHRASAWLRHHHSSQHSTANTECQAAAVLTAVVISFCISQGVDGMPLASHLNRGASAAVRTAKLTSINASPQLVWDHLLGAWNSPLSCA